VAESFPRDRVNQGSMEYQNTLLGRSGLIYLNRKRPSKNRGPFIFQNIMAERNYS